MSILIDHDDVMATAQRHRAQSHPGCLLLASRLQQTGQSGHLETPEASAQTAPGPIRELQICNPAAPMGQGLLLVNSHRHGSLWLGKNYKGHSWVSAPGPDHLWTLSSVHVGEASWENWQVTEDLPASQWSPYHHDMDQALPCILPISVTLCTCHSECLVLLPKADRRVISEQTSPTQTGLRRSLHCTNTMDSGQAAVGGVGAQGYPVLVCPAGLAAVGGVGSQGYPVLACPAGLAAHCLDQSCFASTLGEK